MEKNAVALTPYIKARSKKAKENTLLSKTTQVYTHHYECEKEKLGKGVMHRTGRGSGVQENSTALSLSGRGVAFNSSTVCGTPADSIFYLSRP